ncbi:MAG: hypothetical protein BGO66_19770 [Alicycliphilus sp. 69-12]|nr:MAG: hypothetical protein BGO66_19770 [Alicycliphilus sp. 69-12]
MFVEHAKNIECLMASRIRVPSKVHRARIEGHASQYLQIVIGQFCVFAVGDQFFGTANQRLKFCSCSQWFRSKKLFHIL